MVRIIQFLTLMAMAAIANAEVWCQCKTDTGAHCCVANGASGIYTCPSLCNIYTECSGKDNGESISFITYLGRHACESRQYGAGKL